MTAISTIIFAYAGTPLFFPIAAEMRDPRDYTKAMLLCQSVATVTYIVVGIVIYYYCGSYVASPALGSAGKTIKQIAYGLALPGLIAGATINAHVRQSLPVEQTITYIYVCHRSPENTHSFESFVAQSISQQTPSSTGPLGSASPLRQPLLPIS